jgi:serine/threonine protein phosphatase PrpC
MEERIGGSVPTDGRGPARTRPDRGGVGGRSAPDGAGFPGIAAYRPPRPSHALKTGTMERDVKSGSGTDVGHQRPRNEDALLEDVSRRLFAVADGMGGHPAGDVASREALEAVDEALPAEALHSSPVMEVLARALVSAHERVAAAAGDEPGRRGMGTTAVIAHLDEDESLLTTAHIGDSRAYVLAGDRLVRVTEDHVLGGPSGRSLTQAIGSSSAVEPEAAAGDPRPGDRILLCTDGLTDMLDDRDIRDHLAQEQPPESVCDALIATALDRGGIDNITCIVIDVGP